MPGVSIEDIDIHFEDRQLTIRGKVAPRNEGCALVAGEYGIGDFQRTFTIGEAINAEKIAADLKNGVLSLKLPKSEAVKPRKIAVKAI
jgi:HSP20 family molecular chaperone IbpA